jgi:CheY-like chemotaxis protein
LTISNRLVELMGGQLQVDSEEGIGSTFHFELTMDIDPAVVRATEPLSLSLTEKRCLVVDDNAVNRQIFMRQLSRCGMLVTTAKSGELAQQALAAAPLPDVILLDVHMPDMDGFMLAEWIKAQAALQDIPVLLLSSGPLAGDAERCRLMGIASHHTKPVSNVDLQKAVVQALAGAKKISVAAAKKAAPPSVPALANEPCLAILLVEDNLINQRLATSLLSKWGHRVSLAENGQEAVDQLASGALFDLVLMDMQMPVMGGIEATQVIRRMELEQQLPRMRIVAMTANAMQGDREACIDAGMDDYLSKPIKQSELLEKLSGI